MRFFAIALLSIGLAACGGASMRPAGAGSDDARDVERFQAIEDEILGDLAAIDRRLAARTRIEPRPDDVRRVNMGAVLAEDETLAVVDDAIDPFSFQARERGLAAVRKKLEAAPARLPAGTTGTLSAPALERELLLRLVDAERARLDEERMLPRSASALVRAIVETWKPPQTPDRAAERDRWLARRLDQIKTALTSSALDVVRARELDDALDALEHAIDAPGFGASTAELVKLRERLEAQGSQPSAAATSDWKDVARGVRAHLGSTATEGSLEARLVAAETALEAAAKSSMLRAGAREDEVLARGSALVFAVGPPCTSAVPGSRVRSMAAPPEREAACRLRHALATGDDETPVLVAMHEHVVVARWALDVARGAATIAQTTSKHRPMSRPTPDVAARWERIAIARPTTAIGGGLAAAILMEGNDPRGRARKWAELGEVPLDVVEMVGR